MSLLEGEQDIKIEATSWRGALDEKGFQGVDVCMADAEGDGLERLSAVRGTGVDGGGDGSLVVLAQAGKPGLLRKAVSAKALGYVSKDASRDRLLTAIRQVASGHRYVDETLAVDFLHAAEVPLTPRELTVLSLAAEGAPVPEIARTLHLTRGTVRNYMAAITRKTGARNRIDAIRISQRAGWL